MPIHVVYSHQYPKFTHTHTHTHTFDSNVREHACSYISALNVPWPACGQGGSEVRLGQEVLYQEVLDREVPDREVPDREVLGSDEEDAWVDVVPFPYAFPSVVSSYEEACQ